MNTMTLNADTDISRVQQVQRVGRERIRSLHLEREASNSDAETVVIDMLIGQCARLLTRCEAKLGELVGSRVVEYDTILAAQRRATECATGSARTQPPASLDEEFWDIPAFLERPGT